MRLVKTEAVKTERQCSLNCIISHNGLRIIPYMIAINQIQSSKAFTPLLDFSLLQNGAFQS